MGETYTIDFHSTPEKLQGVIDQAKELAAKMDDELLADQKAHLEELIEAAEKVVEEEKSDDITIIHRSFSKQSRLEKLQLH